EVPRPRLDFVESGARLRLHYGAQLRLVDQHLRDRLAGRVGERACGRGDDAHGLRLCGSCETNRRNECGHQSEHVHLLRGYRSISSSEEERLRNFVAVLAVVLTAGAIALSADLFRLAGLSLYTEQYLAALIAIATPLVFLHVAADGTKGRDRVPWYDLAAAAAAFGAAAYLAWRFPRLSELVSRQPWDGLVAAAVL